ncbi:unnamed protein product [Urochloa humidicola]
MEVAQSSHVAKLKAQVVNRTHSTRTTRAATRAAESEKAKQLEVAAADVKEQKRLEAERKKEEKRLQADRKEEKRLQADRNKEKKQLQAGTKKQAAKHQREKLQLQKNEESRRAAHEHLLEMLRGFAEMDIDKLKSTVDVMAGPSALLLMQSFQRILLMT